MISSPDTQRALPALPHDPLGRPLRTVVLTCSPSGWETARALDAAQGVEVVAVVETPLTKPRTLRARLRNVYKYHGPAGIARIPLNKLRAMMQRAGRVDSSGAGGRALQELRFGNFHDRDCLDALHALHIDLAVVDGTYVLKESVFLLPRFGSINLHCGKLPDYRGAPPAFWELYNGEREVGVTVHRVTAKLDEGPILQQALFALDPTPAGDAARYVRDLWLGVLRPNGIRMLAEAAARIAAGTADERPQGPSTHPTYRRPDFATVRELHRRVRSRRRGAATEMTSSTT